MPNTTIKRNEMADLLKGFAIIFMIAIHIFELFLNSEYHHKPLTQTVFVLGGPTAAAIFMMVMGYFIEFTKKNRQELAKRGVKLILTGFILNILININLLIHIFDGRLPFINPLNFIFGVDILFLAGISTIILAYIKYSPHPKIIALSIFVFMLILLNFTSNLNYSFGSFDYLSAYFIKIAKWSYFPVIPWFIYPLFGLILAQNKKILKYFNPSLFWRIILISIYLIFCLFTVDYIIEITNDLSLYYNHDTKFFGYTLLWLSGYWLIVKQLNFYFGTNKIFIYLRWLGKNVTLAYIIQWVIIGNIGTSVFRTFNIYYSLISFVIITAIVSIIVFYLEDKTKWLKY